VAAQLTACGLYVCRICDTTAPLQLQLPLVGLYNNNKEPCRD